MPATIIRTEPPFLTATNIDGDTIEVYVHGDADEPGGAWLAMFNANPESQAVYVSLQDQYDNMPTAGLSAKQATMLGNRLLELAAQASPGQS